MEATTRRVPSSTNLLKSRPSGILEVHTMTPLEQEEELREAMKLPLASISRQRLRAMQINFRRCSSVDDCISSKELMNVFNEHNLGIPNRTFKMLTTRFNEGVGVNHERLWKFLVEAQSKTGRDSVQAMHKTHNHSLGQRFNEELSSADRAVLEKVHKALVASKEYDLNELRTSCEDKDPSRNGQIPKKKFKRIVEEQHLPLSGALLNNLLKRCDEENNGMVNWFEFMVLLEKAENLSISHTKSATEDGTAQSNHGCKANSTAKKSTNAPVTTNAASKSNVKPGTGKAKGTKVDGVVVRKSVVEKQKVVLKAKGKQINNNITKKSSTEEKEKSLSADQGVKGRSSALSTELGKELNRKVTFRTGESSPSSSCNSSRRGSLSSVAGDSDVFKGNGQASPRIGSTKSRQQSRPGSTVPRPASTVPAQPRPGSSTSAQPRPGSSTNPQPRPVSANQGQDLSPRPGSRSASNSSRRGSITSQGGKKVSLKKPPPLVKRSIKQKDPKLPHSMSMQNMTSISEVSGVTDMHHSKSSPNLLPHAETEEDIEVAESSLNQSMSSQNSIVAAQGQQDNAESSLNQSMSSQNPTAAETQGKKVVAMDARSGTSSIGSINLSLDSSSVSSQEQQGMSRIESCHSLISTSSCSSTDSQAPDKTPLLQGASGIMGSKNWGKPVSLMNSFKGLFSARHKSSDKLTGSRVTLKLPQEPVKMEVVVREQPMSLYIPDNFIDKNFKCEAPKENLVLDWIYGYRGNDCRNNLHCNASGEILYFISCVAVIYNDKQHKQRYYREHTTDIRSMAVHPDQVTIATGQSDLDGTKKGVKICIRIWNCTTLKTAHVIEDDGFQQAIICLSFSQNLLAAVDNYETHTMSLWDCKTFKKVAETKCNTDVVCQIGFHPKITTRIVSVGKDHLVFWDLKGTSIQETMQADYGEHAKPKFTICMLFRSNGDLVTGDSNGMICVWLSGQNTISQVIRTTECPVFALIPYKNSLVSGGRDGSLCVWEVKETISNKTSELFIPTSAGGVRTILIVDQFIYVGTTLNCILGSKLSETESILSGVAIEKELITQGHYDEIHGLKVFPAQTALAPVGSQTSQGVFLTCGYDGMVCCYDTNTHHALWKHWIKECNMQCMDIHPSGKILVTGAKSSDIGSSLCFFSMTVEGSLFELNRMKISKSMITTVKFSPDGQVLAAGCHDGRITTVKLLDDGRSAEVIGKCNIHQSSITGLDWSKVKCYHGNYILQSSSSTLEYFNFTSSCELINNLAESRNADWITNNCMTGFYTNGIWGGDTDVTEFNYVTRSHDQNLIAAGDEDGNVTLFTYPCCKQEAKFKNFRGHTFGVNSVEFGETDKYLISIGNRDCAIIQWTLKK
ncbi:echinoderm microtubule-associated protein-like 3 isoform X12 [Anneissia japonica]|uniref:echinoderm microtubule-associated protein-like 3 isoform X12 n=1 Tax=Anneissia japonica TaxID=1529436 RepID=UPI0014254F01|nr:echinoderm microtubule-associated protein-like 3 isoform X12 [Anneissia japonica]